MQDGYCSVDVETDGNNPMTHSMRSIGVALFDAEGRIHATFYTTIQPQTGCSVDPVCQRDFWNRHPEQWAAVQQNTVTPTVAMHRFAEWIGVVRRNFKIKWIASPACFDWMFVKCYYEKYGPRVKPNIGYYCHDLSSLIRAYTLMHAVPNRMAFVKTLSGGMPYTHNALDDAKNQGMVYCNLRKMIEQDRVNSLEQGRVNSPRVNSD